MPFRSAPRRVCCGGENGGDHQRHARGTTSLPCAPLTHAKRTSLVGSLSVTSSVHVGQTRRVVPATWSRAGSAASRLADSLPPRDDVKQEPGIAWRAARAPGGDEDDVDRVAGSLQGGRRLPMRIIPHAVKCPGCGFSARAPPSSNRRGQSGTSGGAAHEGPIDTSDASWFVVVFFSPSKRARENCPGAREAVPHPLFQKN